MNHDLSSPNIKQIIYDHIVDQYRDDHGLHLETILSALGALAGYACQAGIREGLIETGKIEEDEAFLIVRTIDGDRFFFGDFLNEPLLSTAADRISVFKIIITALAALKIFDYPDAEEIAANAAKSVGYIHFGTPRLASGHMPHEMPRASLEANWAKLLGPLREYADPLTWGWEFASVAKTFILDGREILPPAVAACIFMEAAVPMSKIDLTA